MEKNSNVVLMNCGFSGENVDFSSLPASGCFRQQESKTAQPQSERESPQLPGYDLKNRAPAELGAVSTCLAVSTKHRHSVRIWKPALVGLAILPLLAVLLRHGDSNSTQSGEGKTIPITSQQVSVAAPMFHATSRGEQSIESIAPALAAVEAVTDPDLRGEALERAAESISLADLRAVLDSLVPLENDTASQLRELLTRRWADADSPAAAAWVAQLPEGVARNDALQQVAIAWADHDLPGAVDWLRKLPDGETKQAAMLSTAYEAARTEPLTAVELARALPATRERDELVVHALNQWAVTDFAAAAAWAAQVTEPKLRQQLLAAVAVASAEQDAAKAATFVARSLTPGAAQDAAAVSVVNRWAQQSPRDAARWVSQFPDTPLRSTAEQGLVTLWTARDASGTATWLNELPAGTLRSAGMDAYAQALARGPEIQLEP